ncbi:auxin response factor 18 isoform X1 [Pyrus x bretschneideri]|uniref:auxin response factor 18 isoform X1 n=2 Tax=Pyrus x bretschneideri TaxID=225117 RepID=UPI00202F4C15|nr:auxin response factor 18 isoform X1 [Pyrus x bretschneideri]XP_048446827.1 auxin response factor 18 isoform X1 [Pyrus x bretschneideri]
MITVMDSVREPLRSNSEKWLDSQFWHACAGGMVQLPPINTKVFYFPQGHAEYAHGRVDFGNSRIPPLILSKISAIRYMADPETDEVFAKMRLIPVRDGGFDLEDDGFVGNNGTVENPEKPTSFAKTLTQSDANNGGGFSVPRYCAETIFPRLDYSAEPPVQNILAKDVHGEIWDFRHIYRGTPRRHLLTTGWSNFVNHKKLVAGDSIVFFRAENGDLCVGVRRAKRGIGSGPEYASGNSGSQYGVYSGLSRKNGNKVMEKTCSGDANGKIRAEYVIEAATLAASGQPFEVAYYPRASTPEFCVKASAVRAAMQVRWCSGMRFKMPFETEDSSRISWFMGTISSVQVADPICWPESPWRLLQVSWDEPDLLQNVKRVSPWLVELVSSIPAIHLSPFSSPRKKLRLQHIPDYSLVGQLPMPSVCSNSLNSSNLLCNVSDNLSAIIQGARHAQFGLSSSELFFNKLQSSLFPIGFQQHGHFAPLETIGGSFMRKAESNDNISCCLKKGIPTPNLKDNDEIKTPHIVLFGQVIFTGEQISKSSSGDDSSSDGHSKKTTNCSDGSGSTSIGHGSVENCSDGGSPRKTEYHKSDLSLETGYCKVFIDSGEVGTLDLSVLRSYQELYGKLASMFGKESSKKLRNVLYRDASGVVKRTGDEPFCEFLKTAKRLYMA